MPPAAIRLLAEIITGGSGSFDREGPPPLGIYRSGAALERLFGACGLPLSIGNGSRVPTVTCALDEANGSDDTRNLIYRVVEAVADPLEYPDAPAKHTAVVAGLNRALAPSGRQVAILEGRPRVLVRDISSLPAAALFAHTHSLDLDTVRLDLERAMSQVETDPEDALTSACSLVESVCRTILIRLSRPLPKERNLRPLLDATRDALNLRTPKSSLPPLIAEDVHAILGGLETVANGVAALRTHAGDAHGREAGHPRIDARIARLSANTAGTLALFLVETWLRLAAEAAQSKVAAITKQGHTPDTGGRKA